MKPVLVTCGVALAAVVFGGSAASAQVRDYPSEKPPAPLASRPAPFPAYEIRTLPNGLQVVVVPHDEQPVISLQILVRAGAADDPSGKAGLASLVASLLTQGTRTRTAGAIADAVDTAGAELTTLSGSDASFAQVTVMKDSFAFGLDVLSDIVRDPVFAGEELERQRQQLRSGLRVSYEDPDYIASAVFERVVFGAHPYGLPSDGTPESVGLITRGDLVDFHSRYYVPNNSIVAIVGDVGVDEAFAAASRVFGPWEQADIVSPAVHPPPPPARRLVVVDMPNAVQTEIRAGHIGIARNHDDFLAADLGVRILGGEGGNRLQQMLRTARGLTYGASASLDAYRLGGLVRAETDTRPHLTGEALRVMAEQFSRIHRDDVDAEELDAAKAYLIGSYPMGFEAPGSISTKVLNQLFHNLPLRELETYRERVAALTPETVHAAMRTHLSPTQLAVVVVGPAQLVLPLLRNVGFKDAEVVPVEELDVSRPGLRRGAPMPGASRSGVASVRGHLATKSEWDAARAVVARAADAAGGLPALRAVKTMSATAETVLFTPGGPVNASTKTLVAYPDQFRVDALTAEGVLVQAYNAGHAWLFDKHGPRDAGEAMRRELALGTRRDWIRLLVDALDERLVGWRVPDETATGGRPLHVVELWSDDLPPVRLAVDAASGRIDRLSRHVPGPVGPEIITESFSDFRVVSGLLVPFKAVTRRDDAPVLERTVLELKINPVLEPGVFDKPK
ncbi:MAG: pitrilysin family protein [Vicinamibacterales bacterium]|nr:pitrilysin family protein [Vicinamibacterales bacterium]